MHNIKGLFLALRYSHSMILNYYLENVWQKSILQMDHPEKLQTLIYHTRANEERGFYSKIIFWTFVLWCILPKIVRECILKLDKIQ